MLGQHSGCGRVIAYCSYLDLQRVWESEAEQKDRRDVKFGEERRVSQFQVANKVDVEKTAVIVTELQL